MCEYEVENIYWAFGPDVRKPNGLKVIIEVLRYVRNLKSGKLTISGENSLDIRTNVSPKLDRTRCSVELAFSISVG